MIGKADHRDGRLSRGVLSTGLFGSGSTWAFNVATELMRMTSGCQVHPLYADDLDLRAHEAISHADCFVLKSHLPQASVRNLVRPELPIIMTVRDPRDAVVSVMARFRKDFPSALDQIELSASHLTYLRERSQPLVLRYEEGFTNERGVSAIALLLGVSLSPGEKTRIAHALSAPAIARRVESLLSSGAFNGGNPATEWEPATHWHPHHVGDGIVGKFRDRLSGSEIHKVLYRTETFCRAFGYELPAVAQIPSRSHAEADAQIDGAVDDFIPPNLVLGWAKSPLDTRAQVFARCQDRTIACADANRYRPDLLEVGDGYFGFLLRLSCEFNLVALLGSVTFSARCRDGAPRPLHVTPALLSKAMG